MFSITGILDSNYFWFGCGVATGLTVAGIYILVDGRERSKLPSDLVKATEAAKKEYTEKASKQEAMWTGALIDLRAAMYGYNWKKNCDAQLEINNFSELLGAIEYVRKAAFGLKRAEGEKGKEDYKANNQDEIDNINGKIAALVSDLNKSMDALIANKYE